VGNFIEWYEFGVYGYFATVIAARLFTPEGGGDLTVHGLAGARPGNTGARHPSILGSVTPGREGLRLPPTAEKAPERPAVESPMAEGS